jgi:hypothetical protein
VADDTGTDWAALADVLEDWPYGQPRVTKREAEAAAVGLRRLAQLEAAIGAQPELADSLRKAQSIIRHKFSPAVANPVQRAAEMMDRLAVVLGSGEQPAPPTTCPTCGSDTPMVCHIGLVRPHHHGIIGDGSCCCPDSWHGEQR